MRDILCVRAVIIKIYLWGVRQAMTFKNYKRRCIGKVCNFWTTSGTNVHEDLYFSPVEFLNGLGYLVRLIYSYFCTVNLGLAIQWVYF